MEVDVNTSVQSIKNLQAKHQNIIVKIQENNSLTFNGNMLVELLISFPVWVASVVVGNYVYGLIRPMAKKVEMDGQRTRVAEESITQHIEQSKKHYQNCEDRILPEANSSEIHNDPVLNQPMISGINRELYIWATNSSLFRKAIGNCDPERPVLGAALGVSESERYKASHDLMIKIWRAHPELGLAPDYTLLSQMEYGRDFYDKYRDHMTHMFKVFLLGLYLYEKNENLCKEISRTFSSSDTFLDIWILTALYHDIGYTIENKQGTRDGEAAQFSFSRITASLSYPLSLLFPNDFDIATEKGLQDQYSTLVPPQIKSLTHLERELDEFDKYGYSVQLTLNKYGNPIKAYYHYISQIQEGRYYYDHGIISACILLFIRDGLCRYMDESKKIKLFPKQKQNIERFVGFIPQYKKYTEVAAKAIALHNIKKSWSSLSKFEMNQGGVTIGEFCITLKKDPIAYLLRMCDELQCWDRQVYSSPIGPFSSETPYAGKQIELKFEGSKTKYIVKDNEIRNSIQEALNGVLSPSIEEYVLLYE